jgi:cell division protein FtsZ
MHTDDVERQTNSSTIIVVGLGGAGTNVVTRLSQSKVKGVECVAIASGSPYELQRIPLARKASLYEALAPRKGFDGYPWEGLTVPRIKDMVRREIPELVSKQRLVIVTAGLGRHGGFASSIVARLAREAGNLVVGVVTTSFAFESVECHRYANQALELLLAEANSVITISDTDITSTLEERCLSLSEVKASVFFQTVDELVCEVIKTIIYPMVKPTPPQDFIFSWG